MIDVVVVCEGQTEETLVRDTLAPNFWARDILLHPRLIRTSSHRRGGALSRDRVLRYLRNTLREREDTYVTTLFDLYALDPDLPGVRASGAVRDPIQRAEAIEAALGAAVVREADCRTERFLPHIQPYEFEALVFCDVLRLADLEPAWSPQLATLIAVRAAVPSPEHINDGPATHPSARLVSALRPAYSKVLHGSLITSHIGLPAMHEQCRHFDSWIERLERLQPIVTTSPP